MHARFRNMDEQGICSCGCIARGRQSNQCDRERAAVDVVEWNGRRYRRYPNSKHRSSRVYYQRTFTGGRSWLHRDIWESASGKIPNGYHIHYIDGNPLNNDISNLECIRAKEHFALRHSRDEERVSRSREHLDRIRQLTKAWHSSPEGRAKHREIGASAYEYFVPQSKSLFAMQESVFVKSPRK